MSDLISRQAAIDALNGIINRFEQILRDIRESKVDDSVCGMCEYDGAFVGQSGDWCNECPGFEKVDCFRLSDECRKRWLESVKLPSAQPETSILTVTVNPDSEEIERVARKIKDAPVMVLPSAEPEIKPIDYQDCANAMLRMWMDEVITDGEYNRVMDKLNAFWRTRNERSD